MRVLQWICCPVCGNKTRLQIQADTELKNFPLYCPKCKQESLIDAKNFQITVIRGLNVKRKFLHWGGEKQLYEYIMDSIGSRNSLIMGAFEKDTLVGFSLGSSKR